MHILDVPVLGGFLLLHAVDPQSFRVQSPYRTMVENVMTLAFADILLGDPENSLVYYNLPMTLLKL